MNDYTRLFVNGVATCGSGGDLLSRHLDDLRNLKATAEKNAARKGDAKSLRLVLALDALVRKHESH